MKNIIAAAGALIIVVGISYYFLSRDTSDSYVNTLPEVIPPTVTVPATTTATSTLETPAPIIKSGTSTIGTSVSGTEIVAYHFGTGDKELLLLGGIHGGYSWNTALLSFELIDWLTKNESIIPDNVRVTIIPVLNPDGLKVATGKTGRFVASDITTVEDTRIAGRFNARNVDLNRNFECEWQTSGTWQNRSVSGGSAPFSEPESQAVKNYVQTSEPTAVVTWYSAAGGVYASSCKNGTLPETLTITNLYAKAAGYTAHEEFNYYEITGDMVNWLAGQKIPAISVLLTTHTETELAKNKSGIEALLNHLAE